MLERNSLEENIFNMAHWLQKLPEASFTTESVWLYTINTEVYGHPFKLVDSAILATPVADRCIK